MASPAIDSDEPLTPAGRLFLRPEMNQIIHCVLGVKNPFDIEVFKSQIQESFLLKHPRFCSLMVVDRGGRERWRRTNVDLDRHLIVVDSPVNSESGGDDEASVNEYLAEMSTGSILSPDKPLWEIHLLMAHKCAVFRIHHALGDGISLMSMLVAGCRKVGDPDAAASMGTVGSKPRKSRENWWQYYWNGFVGLIGVMWFSLVFVVEFLVKMLWLSDRKTVISGGDGVELWPRELVTARFRLDDMKIVKKALHDATINDVLFGVISCGLSRYLDHRTPNAVQEGIQLTGLAMVNLRKQPGPQELSELMNKNSKSRWGNKFGFLMIPVKYHKTSGTDPLLYVKRAKVMLDRKKQSLEAHFSYKVGDIMMSYFGSNVAGFLNYRIICNTTFTISNVVGPQEAIAIKDNPVTYMRVNSSSLPHALTMHMLSYAGRADMQILVAKDIIPDPELLAKCFEDSLLEMKEAASAIIKST
ncbi:wax ester synthase/diacylglycerol acyltransferase 11-like [Humulus lupulus]|uniref:wax ester synthase/diacylglycerol acyltransferase 11-like n=1 Tax=Humulus lupulus TaxID=3486 RepID=UPI002B402EDD|nr:wax ester synthase/diacylglycerol acyltransferase 11-like [Humulus lupulus]